MKRLLIILTFIITVVGLTTAAHSNKKDEAASIEFKSTSHDFGTIKEAAGKVSYEFVFTNTGNAPLVIISANAGCGCTKPTYDEAPIQPGKSSSIKVTYNPSGRPGEFVKNVTVKTNDPKHRKVVLKISGTVIPK